MVMFCMSGLYPAAIGVEASAMLTPRLGNEAPQGGWMKKLRLRPAFVVTLTALTPLSCQKRNETANPPPPPTVKGTSESPPPPTGSGTTESPPPQPMKRRPVRSPLPAPAGNAAKFDWVKAKQLNPRLNGSPIIAAKDGSCFVEVRADPSAPIGPPGSGLVAKPVDCPDVMQDPAFDTCIGGTLMQTAEAGCVCARSGNPPPPPEKAECPK
jgi:hypothetical protein